MAKRHYDLALETNSEAYLPVVLSLAKLYARSIWHTMMGGAGGLNIWNPSDEDLSMIRKSLYLTKSLILSTAFSPKSGEPRELDEGKQRAATEEGLQEEERAHVEEEDGPWYFGKAKEEFHRRRSEPRSGREEEDPIQASYDHSDHDRY